MANPRGDRFGGVVFDVQQYRKQQPLFPPGDARERMIKVISSLISLVEDMDELSLMVELEVPNPRIEDAEERLVVTDLCDLLAFEKNENAKRRLRRAINFIEGHDCFPGQVSQ